MQGTPRGAIILIAGLFASGGSAQDRPADGADATQTRPAATADVANVVGACRCDPEASYFGLNGTKMFHIPGDLASVERRIGWMREAGVCWDRSDLWWGVVEPRRGEFDFSRPDQVLATLESHGIAWYPILCYGAAWFEPGRTAPQTPEEFEAYAEYVYRTVARYRGRVRYWEVWNEPNIEEFWRPEPDAGAYTRLLKLAYAAIKRADPEALVCAPGIAPLGPWDRRYVEAMYQHGAAGHFDVFDYHYYRNDPPEADVPNEIAEIRAVMRHYDRERPIQISESGVTTIHRGRGDEAHQAAMVVRNHLLCLALGVQRFYYFDLQNWGDDSPENPASQLGLVTAAGTPKPAFEAYKTLVAQVDGREFVGRLHELGEGVEGVLIHARASDEYVLAAWLTDEGAAREIEVTCRPQTVRIVEPFGDVRVLPFAHDEDVRDRTVRVTIDRHPRYIHGVDPLEYLPDAGVRFDVPLTLLTPGQSAAIPIIADARLPYCEVEVESRNVPAGVDWPGRSARLRLLPGAGPGRYRVEARVAVTYGPRGDRRLKRLTRVTEIEHVPLVELDPRFAVDGERLMLHAAVANHGKELLRQELLLVADPGAGEAVLKRLDFGPLQPRQTRFVAAEIPRENLLRGSATRTLEVRYGDAASRPTHVYPVLWRDAAPVVDGDLGDWTGVPAMRIGDARQVFESTGDWSPEDASAEGRVLLAGETLYVAARVVDDVPLMNDARPHETWKGDSLELFGSVCGPTKRTVISDACDVHLGIAPRAAGREAPFVFWYRRDEVVEAATVAARETADGYVLEAAIPLAALGASASEIRPGMLVGIDMTLNDADEPAREGGGVKARAGGGAETRAAGGAETRAAGGARHRLVWNGTARNWIDPSGYAIGVVVRE